MDYFADCSVLGHSVHNAVASCAIGRAVFTSDHAFGPQDACPKTSTWSREKIATSYVPLSVLMRPLRRQAHPLSVQFKCGFGIGEFLNDFAVFEMQDVYATPGFVFLFLALLE